MCSVAVVPEDAERLSQAPPVVDVLDDRESDANNVLCHFHQSLQNLAAVVMMVMQGVNKLWMVPL